MISGFMREFCKFVDTLICKSSSSIGWISHSSTENFQFQWEKRYLLLLTVWGPYLSLWFSGSCCCGSLYAVILDNSSLCRQVKQLPISPSLNIISSSAVCFFCFCLRKTWTPSVLSHLSVVIINDMAQSNLEEKRVYLTSRWQFIIKGSQDGNSKTEFETEIMEEHCLLPLTYSSNFFFSFLFSF